jgi:hypothetical protein
MAGMKYRKLRIAWSAACAVLCLMLFGLWLGSYFVDHIFDVSAFGQGAWILSRNGNLDFSTYVWAWTPPRFFQRNYLESFDVPYWMPTIAATTFAMLPWISWPNRFSLRTLLIATTLVAVLLGIIIGTG